MNFRELEGLEKWLLNYARNASKPIPVESAITTTKPNAPRRLPSMRLRNHVASHQETRKIEIRNVKVRFSHESYRVHCDPKPSGDPDDAPVVAAVPEVPTAWLMLLGSFAILGARRLRGVFGQQS